MMIRNLVLYSQIFVQFYFLFFFAKNAYSYTSLKPECLQEFLTEHPSGLIPYFPCRATIFSSPDASHPSYSLFIKSAVSLSPGKFRPKFGDTIDFPSSNVRVMGLTGELGQEWLHTPAPLQIDFNLYFSSQLSLTTQYRFKPIIDGWYSHTLQHNLLTSVNDFDINEPYLGYFNFKSSLFSAQVGRFPLHWAPSPYFGLALSNSAPYHDGFTLSLTKSFFTYKFLFSSLNPWLTGTLKENGTFDTHTEAYLQSDFSKDHNSRNLVYTVPTRTLLAHRTEWNFHFLSAGITELLMVGGKPASWRDASPLVLWHNNYGEGFSNLAFSFDSRLKIPNFSLFTELFLDDYKEADDGGTPTQLGYLIGLEHSLRQPSFFFLHHIHYISTDPHLYNHRRPLTRLYQRQMLRSNHITLGSSPFIDTYIIDYPLGYVGGADRQDIRYTALFSLKNLFFLQAQLLYLAQGEANPYIPFRVNGTYTPQENPSGTPQEQWIGELQTCSALETLTQTSSLHPKLSICLGAGASYTSKKFSDTPLSRPGQSNTWLLASIQFGFGVGANK